MEQGKETLPCAQCLLWGSENHLLPSSFVSTPQCWDLCSTRAVKIQIREWQPGPIGQEATRGPPEMPLGEDLAERLFGTAE